jgi:hypothetical protein
MSYIDFQHFSNYLLTGLKPDLMLFVFHPMPPLVLRRMNSPVEPLYCERKFGEIVVIKPEAGNILPPGQLAVMFPHFQQPVTEHG